MDMSAWNFELEHSGVRSEVHAIVSHMKYNI